MTDLSNPPRIERYVPVDHAKVDFAGGFWESWSKTVREVTAPSQYRKILLTSTGKGSNECE